MNIINLVIMLMINFIIGGLTFIISPAWQIGEEYSIKFSGTNAEGTISGLSGSILFDKEQPESGKMDVSVKVATISMGDATKDEHAKSESWFHVTKYPYIKFISSAFAKTATGYTVRGMLELHGTKKEIIIPFTFHEHNDKQGVFQGTFKIKRKDYGVVGPFFGWGIGNEISITMKVPVSQQ